MRITISIFLSLFITASFAQTSVIPLESAGLSQSGLNELTIFIIPAKAKFDWSSPRTLYKSYFKNYRKNIFNKKSYTLGHAFVQLCTPLSSSRIFTGMRAASGSEPKNLVLKDHYGLSILGADMDGTLETDSELVCEVRKYSKKGQLAFITFFISDEATERLLQFYRIFKSSNDSSSTHGPRYGGAFWPRYTGEGSGCSAFVMSSMDLAGLLEDEFSYWLVKVNIPMELIGGPYNNGNEVKLKDIKKQTCWSDTCEPGDAGYEHFEIYDPTLISEWIKAKWDEENSRDGGPYTPLRLNQAKGLLIDCRNQPAPGGDSIFMERDKPSIFIDYYNQKYHLKN